MSQLVSWCHNFLRDLLSCENPHIFALPDPNETEIIAFSKLARFWNSMMVCKGCLAWKCLKGGAQTHSTLVLKPLHWAGAVSLGELQLRSNFHAGALLVQKLFSSQPFLEPIQLVPNSKGPFFEAANPIIINLSSMGYGGLWVWLRGRETWHVQKVWEAWSPEFPSSYCTNFYLPLS